MQNHRRPHGTLNGDLNSTLVQNARARRAPPRLASPLPSPPGTPDSVVEVYFSNDSIDNGGGSPHQTFHFQSNGAATGYSPSIARSMSPRPSYFSSESSKNYPPPPPYSKTATSYKHSTSSPIQSTSKNASPPMGLSWRNVSIDFGNKKRRPASQKTWFDNSNVIRLVFVVLVLTTLYLFCVPKEKRVEIQKAMRPNVLTQKSMSSSLKSTTTKKKRPSYKDQLRADVSYLISPNHGDLALQVQNFYHLAHLASNLHRSLIATPFNLPAGTNVGPATLPFSSIFDMRRFTELTDVKVVDYDEIRPHEAELIETLGCWIGSAATGEMENRFKSMMEHGLATTYFPMNVVGNDPRQPGDGDALLSQSDNVPSTGRRVPDFGPSSTETHNFLANFDRDTSAKDGLAQQALHSQQARTFSGAPLTLPETQVMCIDHTLYRPEHPTTSHSGNHLDPIDHTAFHSHGRALHFATEIQETGLEIASFVLGHRGPYIAVHISGAAQRAECVLRGLPDACEIALSKFTEAVEQARHLAMVNLKSGKNREHRHNTKSLSVLVSTDISDLGFRGELSSLGWTLLEYDDLELVQRFGAWSPEIMDGVIHSSAKAFVGTRGSAKSTLAALRVEAWRQGPTLLVS